MTHTPFSHRLIPALSADQLLDVQEKGFLWTVKHAYENSPQYRAKFEEAGLKPGDVTSLDDILKLPVTTTDDLRAGYPLPLLSVPERDVVRVHASSGTTGKRKILAYTQRDVDTFALQMARCYAMAGLTDQDRIQIAVGYGLWTAGVGFQGGAEKLGAMAVPVGAGNLEIHLQLLEDMGSTCLCCTSSMALLMGEEVQRHNLRNNIRLKKIIFGSEAHSVKMRADFEEALGLEASYDIGGMTEMYGPGTAIECAAHEGLHYWGDLFIIEFLNPETLTPVKPGETGEMVVTSLRKEAAPLIRYRTRDLCRALPGDCPCGCGMPRHDHLLGRSDDMIVFRGVNIYPGQISAILQEFTELGSEYHLELNRKEGKDYMTVKVETRPAIPHEGEAAATLAKRLEKLVHSRLLVGCSVQTVEYGGLSRSFGKTKRITDNRLL